jgi:phage shock protein PspC (stress-responsive transcriptional regulator)
MIAGVCGGLGSYLGIDATLVRIFFVLFALANGIGVPIYLILWLVVPPEGHDESLDFEGNIRRGAEEISARAQTLGEEIRQASRRPHPQAPLIIGAALIILGVFTLLNNLNLPFLQWVRFEFFWPVLLIIAGVVLLVRQFRGE